MGAAESQDFDQATGISEDDQREIMLEIERVASGNRIDASDDVFSYTPLKSGSVFPIIVNVVGVVILAGGVFLLSQLFAGQDAELRSSAQAVVTAESRLIEEIRRETEAALAAREAEIAEIQDQLASISEERNALATDLEDRVQQRESALREQFQAELEAERSRLIGLNLSEAEIESRLEQFSEVKEREYEQRLDQFRRQAEEEQQQLAAELDALESQFSRTLENASAEREQLLEDSQNRLAELQSNFEDQLAANEAQLNEAEAQLAQLAEEQQRTELVRSQLRGLYGAVDAALEAGELDAAQDRLRDVRTLLNEDAVLRIPALREQRPVDLFVVDALEQLIGLENRFGNPDTLSRLNDAAVLNQMNERVIEASAAAGAGNTELARTLYQQAIDLIPAMSESVEFLATADNDDAAAQVAAVNEIALPLMAAGRQALEAEQWSAAIDDFTGVLEQAPTSRFRVEAVSGIRVASENLTADQGVAIEELENQIVEIGADLEAAQEALEAAADEQDALSQELLLAQDDLAAAEERSAATAGADEEELEAAQARVSVLEDDLERATTRVATLEDTVAARNGSLEETEAELITALDDLAVSQGRTAQAEAIISDLNSEITTLRNELAANGSGTGGTGEPALTPELEAEIATLRQLESDVAAAQASYQSYLGEAAGDDSAQVLRARVALERFLSASAMAEWFPDLSGELGRFDNAFVASGRENAFLDIADLITELSIAESASERSTLLASARQSLADQGAEAAAGELVSELEFLVQE